MIKHSKISQRVLVKACRKCGVLLGREYLHDLCTVHFKEEYGYEPEDRYGSVGKRQDKQARETIKLREKCSKKQDKERENYRKLQEDGVLFSEKLFTMRGKQMRFEDFPYVRQVFHDNARIVVLLWARNMTKMTTIASILTHKLITNAYSGAMVAALRDKQAWQVTKEHIRPRFTESRDKMLLPANSGGSISVQRAVA